MPAEVVKCDVCVVGAGVAGVAAAVALREHGHRVVVVAKSGGASSVSSGALDLGPVPNGTGDFASLRGSREGERLYRSVLVDRADFGAPEEVSAALTALGTALTPDLPMTLALDRPLCLPSPLGGWKRTYGAQTLIAGADLSRLSGRRVGFVASRQWRFPSDVLAARWTEQAKRAGHAMDIVPLWIELRGADWPLPQLATRLVHDERFRDLFTEYVTTALGVSSFDTLLFPPLFLDAALADRLHEKLGLPIAECLSGTEPVAGKRLSDALLRTLTRLEIPFLRSGGATDPLVPTLYHERVTGLRDSTRDIRARHYVLATGKYFGGGVRLEPRKLEEPLFGAPLFRVRGEARLHSGRAIPTGGRDSDEAEPWAAVGVHVDEKFRPVDERGTPWRENVAATGSVLGGADFARHRLGAGFMAYAGHLCGRSLD